MNNVLGDALQKALSAKKNDFLERRKKKRRR